MRRRRPPTPKPPTPVPVPVPPPTPIPAPTPGATTVAAQIAGDMAGKSEGHPHGVPSSYDWYAGPVVVMGNNAGGWKALNGWGVVYEASEGNPATNTRVNIRNMRVLLQQKSDGKWLMVQSTSKPDGEAYVENFAGDNSKPASIRSEADGSISTTAGGGYNFHFWPPNRGSIDPNNIGGIVVVVEARLITADPTKPADMQTARYLCGSGADYYPALTGGWPGNPDFNPGVALGKQKYVKPEWRSFCMTTLTADQLAKNPPPISLDGISA